MKSHVPAEILKNKFQKSQKHNNPNLRDLDQRERESSPHQRAGLGSRDGLGGARPGFSSGFFSNEFLVWPGFFSDEFFSDARHGVFFFFSRFFWVLLWCSSFYKGYKLSLKTLDFHVVATWKKCHIRHN